MTDPWYLDPCSGPTIPIEIEIQLRAARAYLGEELRTGLMDGLPPKRWPQFERSATAHRLLQVVAHVAREKNQATGMPRNWLEVAADQERKLAQRNMGQLMMLANVKQALDREGIPFLVLKGVSLAWPYYRSVGHRTSADIDVLIRPEDIARTVAILEEKAGLKPELGLPPHLQALQRKWDNEFYLVGQGIHVDLHWHLFRVPSFFSVEMHELQARAQPLKLGSCTLATMGIEDLVVYLAFHGWVSLWRRLTWLLDFALVAARLEEDQWPPVWQRAAAFGQERSLALALLLRARLLGCPVPGQGGPALLTDLVDRAHFHRAMAFLCQNYAPDALLPHEGMPREELRWALALRPSLAFKGKVLWRYLTQPSIRDLQAVTLPRGLTLLYSFIRPIRLLTRRYAGEGKEDFS